MPRVGQQREGRRGRLIRQYLVVTIFNFCLDLWIFIYVLFRRAVAILPSLRRDAISLGVASFFFPRIQFITPADK